MPTSFPAISLTSSNTAQAITLDPTLYFEDLNIHVYTHDIYYGDGNTMKAVCFANDIITFRKGFLKDIFIKSKTAGSHASVVAVGTLVVKGV